MKNKLIITSDLHGQLPDIKEAADILVIAGDICPNFYRIFTHDIQSRAMQRECKSQIDWLKTTFQDWILKLDILQVVCTWGNHDWIGQFSSIVPKIEHCHILNDTPLTINGIKFFGSPWQLPFCDWAFNTTEDKLKDYFYLIPDDTEILIAHSPPYKYCDTTKNDRSKYLGSKSLNNRIRQLKSLKLVCCGHIHTGYGIATLKEGPKIINASLINEEYKMTQQPVVIYIEDNKLSNVDYLNINFEPSIQTNNI